jgi:hypothetical protein
MMVIRRTRVKRRKKPAALKVVEYCPLCLQRLGNHAGAVSHYRAHARVGELISNQINEAWRLPDDPREIWWSSGFRRNTYEPLPVLRDRYLDYLWRTYYSGEAAGDDD